MSTVESLTPLPSAELDDNASSLDTSPEGIVKGGFFKLRAAIFNLGYNIKLPVNTIAAEETRLAELRDHRWAPSDGARGNTDRAIAMVRSAHNRVRSGNR